MPADETHADGAAPGSLRRPRGSIPRLRFAAPRPVARAPAPQEAGSAPRSRLRWLPEGPRYWLTGLRAVVEMERSWLVGALRFFWSKLAPRGTVLFYPERPHRDSVAYYLCALLGYRISNDGAVPADHRVRYENATWPTVPLPSGASGRFVNGACVDIGKQAVERAFAEVFGYELAVDPLVHDGPMIEKTERNAVKDIRVVNGPLPPERVRAGFVYERLIENRAPGAWLVDFRVPVYDGRIPLVYVLYRRPLSRFSLEPEHAQLVDPLTCFSPQEIDRIGAFARSIGIGFGELDVLRDRNDGRIYVVDANNTPHGPPDNLSPDDVARSHRILAEAFEAMLEGLRSRA